MKDKSIKINTIRSIIKNELEHLQWGCSIRDIEKLCSKTKVINQELISRKYPFLSIDGVEFYFENEDFSGLNEVIIQAWRIQQNDFNILFNHDWINDELSLDSVKNKLDETDLSYIEKEYSFIIDSGSTFLFYDTEKPRSKAELCKIVLHCKEA